MKYDEFFGFGLNDIRQCAWRILAGAVVFMFPQWLPAYASLEGLSCLLEPSVEVELTSQQPGIIRRILVERGDKVKKGQIVVQLASGVEQAALELAQARYEFGLRKAKRNIELVKKELISSQEKDEMDTENAVSAAEYHEARARLALRTIRSPISGIVMERLKSPGDYVGADPVLKIIDIDPLNVEVIAPVSAIGKVKVGMKAHVIPGIINTKATATVIIVDPAVDPSSDTFGIRLRLDNPKNKIPAGLKCTIEFLDN